MRNFAHRWPQSWHFSQKLGHFFPISEKCQGRPTPSLILDTRLKQSNNLYLRQNPKFYFYHNNDNFIESYWKATSELQLQLFVLSFCVYSDLLNVWKDQCSSLFQYFLVPSTNGCRFKNSSLEVFCKLGVLKHFEKRAEKQLCWSHFLIKLQTSRAATLLKRDSCEFCDILKNTLFAEQLRIVASVDY